MKRLPFFTAGLGGGERTHTRKVKDTSREKY